MYVVLAGQTINNVLHSGTASPNVFSFQMTCNDETDLKLTSPETTQGAWEPTAKTCDGGYTAVKVFYGGPEEVHIEDFAKTLKKLCKKYVLPTYT